MKKWWIECFSHAESYEKPMGWRKFSCQNLWILFKKSCLLIHWCQVAVASADARPSHTGPMSAFAGCVCSWGKTHSTSLSYPSHTHAFSWSLMLSHALSCSHALFPFMFPNVTNDIITSLWCSHAASSKPRNSWSPIPCMMPAYGTGAWSCPSWRTRSAGQSGYEKCKIIHIIIYYIYLKQYIYIIISKSYFLQLISYLLLAMGGKKLIIPPPHPTCAPCFWWSHGSRSWMPVHATSDSSDGASKSEPHWKPTLIDWNKP